MPKKKSSHPPNLIHRSSLSASRPSTPTLSSHGGTAVSFAQQKGLALSDVLDFSASINPQGFPPAVRSAYRRTLAHIVHYPEAAAESLTRALADYHRVKPDRLLVGNGSTQLIHLLAPTFVPRRVLFVAPLFSEYAQAFRLAGVETRRFFLRPPGFALSLSRLLKTLTQGCDMLVLSNPNSPTGSLIGRAQLEELAGQCRLLQTRLIVDEAFVDWQEEASLKDLAAHSAHVVVLRSLTKFFALPGLRVGYVISHPRTVQQLRARMEPWSVNSVAQAVALECLRDEQFIKQSRDVMAHERAWLFAKLSALEGVHVFPSHANFFLVRVQRTRLDALALASALAEEHILIRSCENFAGLGKQFFRIAVRKRAENRRLLRALRKALQS